MAALVSIGSRHGRSIEACHRLCHMYVYMHLGGLLYGCQAMNILNILLCVFTDCVVAF